MIDYKPEAGAVKKSSTLLAAHTQDRMSKRRMKIRVTF